MSEKESDVVLLGCDLANTEDKNIIIFGRTENGVTYIKEIWEMET